MKEKIAVALIGCGRIGWLLEKDPLRKKPASHLGALKKLAHIFELTAACDLNQNRLKAFIKENSCSGFLNYRDLIKSKKADFIIIATPTATHYEIADFAIKHGIKGIILEKPACASLAETKKLLSSAQRAGVPVIVNHERRYDPLFQKCRELITKESGGKLKTIFGKVYTQYGTDSKMPAGYPVAELPLMHDGTHLLDLLRYLAGEVQNLTGFQTPVSSMQGNFLEVGAVLQMRNGSQAYLEFCGKRGYFHFELDIYLEHCRIRAGNGIKEFYRARPSHNYSGFQELYAEAFPQYEAIISPFCGALLDLYNVYFRNLQPVSSLYDALKAEELIFAILNSARRNCRKINFLH